MKVSRKARRFFPALALVLVPSGLVLAGGARSLVDSMKIQTKIQKPAGSEIALAIRIEPIKTDVPLDDRWNADEIFLKPFLEELRMGISYYLTEKGIAVRDAGEDVRLEGTITHYEGFKGWGHWGADLRMEARFFRGDVKLFEKEIGVLLRYSDDEDVEDEMKPVFKAKTGSKAVSFPEILFTRVSADLAEKLYTMILENKRTLTASGA